MLVNAFDICAIVSSARVACFLAKEEKKKSKKGAIMYKYYIDSWSPYSKVTFSWASNREIKDYLEFASKNLATITFVNA